MDKKTLKISREAHNKLSEKKVELNKENPEYNITFTDVIINLLEN